MATITIGYTTLCGQGIPAVNASGYGPILRQKVNCVLTPLLASKSYSLFKIPKGFVKRHAVVNVTTASAAATTLSVGSNQKDGSGNQIVYNATVALNAEASTLLDIDKPTRRPTRTSRQRPSRATMSTLSSSRARTAPTPSLKSPSPGTSCSTRRTPTCKPAPDCAIRLPG